MRIEELNRKIDLDRKGLMKNWKKEFPLNTFYGETKRQLEKLISKLITSAKVEGMQEVFDNLEDYGLVEKLPK